MRMKGITLVELLLIISIITLLTLIVIPHIDITKYWLISNSRVLRDDIRNVRYLNMSEGKNLKILLGNNEYVIVENGIEEKRVVFKSDFKLVHNFKNGNIYFSHIGSPQQGGTIRIISNKKNQYCEITIVPATGRVLLKDEIFKGYTKH